MLVWIGISYSHYWYTTYFTLFVPHLSTEIYFSVQLIVLVYISINIAETIRTYLYFDKYKPF